MVIRKKRGDKHLQLILETLQRLYLPSHPTARIDAYRYNSACIRVRIIDRDFAGMHMNRRHDRLWDLLEALPEDTQSEISLLFLFTPNEARTSQMNGEFEDHFPGRRRRASKSDLARRDGDTVGRSSRKRKLLRKKPAGTTERAKTS